MANEFRVIYNKEGICDALNVKLDGARGPLLFSPSEDCFKVKFIFADIIAVNDRSRCEGSLIPLKLDIGYNAKKNFTGQVKREFVPL